MLLNNFYTCHNTQFEACVISCRIEFDAAHAIFKGHFPGNPVVPGVCMMEIVKELLQTQVQEQLTLRSTGNVKFLQLITPEIKPEIKIEWSKNESVYSVKASISRDSVTHFKFDGVFVPSATQ